MSSRSIGGSTCTVILAGSGIRVGRSRKVSAERRRDLDRRDLDPRQPVPPRRLGEAPAAGEEQRRLLPADRHDGHDRHARLARQAQEPRGARRTRSCPGATTAGRSPSRRPGTRAPPRRARARARRSRCSPPSPPYLRSPRATIGMFTATSWTSWWKSRSDPKCLMNAYAKTNVSAISVPPEWLPTSSTGPSGMFSSPRTSGRKYGLSIAS